MTEPDQTRAPDDAAVAFDAMRRQLALLSAAVEGFASRQQAIAARDYAPDLEKIAERIARVNHNIGVLAERPGVALTPEEVARQIDAAGKSVREGDHAALAQEQHAQAQTAQQLDALMGAAMVGLVAAMLLILLGGAELERMDWRPSDANGRTFSSPPGGARSAHRTCRSRSAWSAETLWRRPAIPNSPRFNS